MTADVPLSELRWMKILFALSGVLAWTSPRSWRDGLAPLLCRRKIRSRDGELHDG
jgi:hypothetical protein